jgi:hypothetical protein
MSYADEQNAFLDDLERANRTAVVRDFIALGESVGVDVAAELLDNHKTAQDVFDSIRSKTVPNG